MAGLDQNLSQLPRQRVAISLSYWAVVAFGALLSATPGNAERGSNPIAEYEAGTLLLRVESVCKPDCRYFRVQDGFATDYLEITTLSVEEQGLRISYSFGQTAKGDQSKISTLTNEGSGFIAFKDAYNNRFQTDAYFFGLNCAETNTKCVKGHARQTLADGSVVDRDYSAEVLWIADSNKTDDQLFEASIAMLLLTANKNGMSFDDVVQDLCSVYQSVGRFRTQFQSWCAQRSVTP